MTKTATSSRYKVAGSDFNTAVMMGLNCHTVDAYRYKLTLKLTVKLVC